MKVEADAQIILWKHEIASKKDQIAKLAKELQDIRLECSQQTTELTETSQIVNVSFHYYFFSKNFQHFLNLQDILQKQNLEDNVSKLQADHDLLQKKYKQEVAMTEHLEERIEFLEHENEVLIM